ncbi:hypothetical protein GGR52DRAFT_575564 [Hypoxylon sp. FL1284]|nr:hypothetical protein GGR52DRAFT_575564 [Hypoxylon sp. FL1284]
MDPLSITSAAIAIIQACNAVLNICYRAYSVLKIRTSSLGLVQAEVQELRSVLELIFQLAADAEGSSRQHEGLKILAQSQTDRGPLVTCSEDLRALEEILAAKYTKNPQNRTQEIMRRISWELSEREVRPILDRMVRSKATLNLALSANKVALITELRKTSSMMASGILSIEGAVKDITADSKRSHLVTSREEETIRRSLAGFLRVRIEDRLSDVSLDISRYIGYRFETDPDLQWLSADVKRDILMSLITHAAGMFRWAHCQIEALSQLRTVKAIRRSLEELPRDLHETYDRILARISRVDRDLARRVLLWVSFAVTPLTLEEIRSAIAIEPELDHLDDECLLRSQYEIPSLVGGLVHVTDHGHVMLAHMSVKDYLLFPELRGSDAFRYFHFSVQDSNAELFRYCMAYLSFRLFEKGPSDTCEDYQERVRAFPLLRHAAISWPYLYQAAAPSQATDDAVMSFFAEENRTVTMSWVQIVNADTPSLWSFYPRHATSLYYAATFGLTAAVQRLIGRGVDLDAPGSRYGGTALHGAAYRMHKPSVILLLEAGADANKADFLNVMPLHTAATLKDVKLVKLLLRFLININAINTAGKNLIK